jgi:ethanolamine ammonia-lyase small subunit
LGHTDAERNLISNIHTRGVTPAIAVGRILRLAERLMQACTSGITVKEEGVGEKDHLQLPLQRSKYP